MDWIPWNSLLPTGHEILDSDHKILVDLFNQLATGVKERKGKIACLDLLAKIIEHSKAHFALEEQLMAQHGYPKTGEHAADHARLISQAIKFRTKFEAESDGSHIPLIHFPEDWLTIHILGADKKLAEFLCAPDSTAAHHS